MAYNFLPKWTPPKLYEHRGQWAATAYKVFKAPYNTISARLFCEMVRWGEIAALMSGITTVQGTAPNRLCFRGLVRNIENQHDLGLTADHIRTFILDIRSFRSTIDFTKTRSFVVHLAEGFGPVPLQEFEILKSKGLLRSETAIIHGAAFGDHEFEQMGKAGVKLIWSPQSNLALYGKTTNIPLAKKHGVEVSLGVDWNASGSDTLFDELRVAQQVDDEQWGGVITAGEWVRMITSHPARALAVDALIGTLQAGRKADITIVRARGTDPGTSLLQNYLADVEGVWIGGELLYGSASVVQAVRPTGCEAIVVLGSAKRVCAPMTALANALGKQFPWLAPVVK